MAKIDVKPKNQGFSHYRKREDPLQTLDILENFSIDELFDMKSKIEELFGFEIQEVGFVQKAQALAVQNESNKTYVCD